MSKHTYGFPVDTDKDEAIVNALAQAKADPDGFITDQTDMSQVTTEILEGDEYLNATDDDGTPRPHFVVVVRTPDNN